MKKFTNLFDKSKVVPKPAKAKSDKTNNFSTSVELFFGSLRKERMKDKAKK